MSEKHVLVTGGTGFIAGHCILQLLEQGHRVRTTIRSLAKEAAARRALADAGMVHGANLAFVAADLLHDAGWVEAAADVDLVLHVASPVQPGQVANEDDLIVPARDGALRVLRAARGAGVKRVVLTSAFHAVGWGHLRGDRVFTEKDWTIVDGPGVDAYGKSKTLAERAAWDFMTAEGGALELTTMLPVAVMGALVGKAVSGANHIVQRMLEGAMPGFPDLYIPIIDVRDVASAHIAAMIHPGAAGERFLLSNGRALPMKEIGATIRASVGEAARRVPTRSIPSLALRLAAPFSSSVRPFVRDLGHAKRTSNEKARRVLGWAPRDAHEAVEAAAKSMVQKGVLKP